MSGPVIPVQRVRIGDTTYTLQFTDTTRTVALGWADGWRSWVCGPTSCYCDYDYCPCGRGRVVVRERFYDPNQVVLNWHEQSLPVVGPPDE